MSEQCPHGLEIQDVEPPPGEPGTYCASCMAEALWDGSLGICMGIHPDIKRKQRNKEKAKRRKEKGKK